MNKKVSMKTEVVTILVAAIAFGVGGWLFGHLTAAKPVAAKSDPVACLTLVQKLSSGMDVEQVGSRTYVKDALGHKMTLDQYNTKYVCSQLMYDAMTGN